MQYNIGIYTRLSIEDKNKQKIESESILNQKSMIENFIDTKEDFLSSNKFYYVDDGYVGTNFERPAFKLLIEDIRNKKINCIIVKDLSRFGRDYIEVNNYLDKVFPLLNVRFISINDNYDSIKNKNFTVDLDISFKNILYNYYSKDLSKKVKTGMIAKAKQGYYIHAFAPFGYKINKETQKLEIDEETDYIVKMIFKLKSENKSNTQIAKILNDERIPNRSYFKAKNNIRNSYPIINKNKIWKSGDIEAILKHDVYIGTTTTKFNTSISKYKDNQIIKIENTHKPIIDKKLFYEINNVEVKRRNIQVKSIFAYKLKCGFCEYGLHKKYINQNNEKWYHCKTGYESKNERCKNVSIVEGDLKQIVFESLKKQIALALEKNDYVQNISSLKSKISSLENKLDEINNQNKYLYEQYAYKKITRQNYLKMKMEKTELINEIKQEIEEINLTTKELKNVDNENKLFEKYINCTELTKEMVDTFVKKIYIYDNNEIKIVWNFKNFK